MDCPIVPIKICLDPTPPFLSCSKTKIYGAPKGRTGRVPPLPAPQIPVPILGIAIHCVRDNYQGYLSKVCLASPNLMPCGHASFHYVIDADSGQVSCLVKEENVSWSFQSYLSNFPLPNPLEPYPGWTILSGLYPSLSADFYTLNIGITVPSRPEQEIIDGEECCFGPYGMLPEAYKNLIRLVNYLAFKYNIPLDDQHIGFHDDITETKLGCEECPCRDNNCFLCDVTSYCESCTNSGDPTFIPSDDIFWIYGETESGCKVKIKVSDLLGV